MGKAMAAGAAIALFGSTASVAEAHDLILRYNLPVPFWLYLYASGATLVLTFAVFGWFIRAPAGTTATRTVRDDGAVSRPSVLPPYVVLTLRILALACLALTVVAGLIGTRDPDRNVSLILFWQVFLLGLTYATAFVGNVYEIANPWRWMADWLDREDPASARPRFDYPAQLGYWPAVVFYIVVIWLELFTHPRPYVLATMLIVYTLITLAGAWAFGKDAWFRYGETFSVFLRVVGSLAPLAYRRMPGRNGFDVRLRWPFLGVLEERAEHMSLVVFVLFMLSSTTFDGIHQTIVWMGLFWKHLVVWAQPLWGTDLLASQRMLEKWFAAYQRAGLVLSPFFYLVIYLAVCAIIKAVTSRTLSARTLALEFVFTIVPIAFVYNVTHYYTTLLLNASKLPALLSDPFGWGWNPFGLNRNAEPPTLNMAAVWHTEVALILIGHVISVYLAHRVALRLFPRRRDAMISQLPMLVLMVFYTVVGLWVISLPFALT